MSQSRVNRGGLDRRSALVSGSAFVGAAAIPNAVAGAIEPGLAPAGDLLAAIVRFSASLEPGKLKSASFAWHGPEWQSWNYFGIGGFTKPGLRLEHMSVAQKEAAWGVVGVLMSPGGLAKTRNVMLLQDILAASGNRAGERSSERFSFSIFGTPAETGAWGFRLEGHHLTHSIAVRDNRIVSVTPSSFSALPNRVTSGKHAGLVTLRDEEGLARRLIADLAPKQQARARAADSPLGNILSYAGRERSNAQKVGLPAAELGPAQRDLLWQLVETFAVDYLSPPLADAQRTRVRAGDRDATHFAWYGPNSAEKAFGYRVIGDGFVIELGSVDPAAQHLHTIYHDLGNVLGRTA